MLVERRTTHLVLQVVLSPQHATRSEPNESFSQAITHDLALSVPHRMVSVSTFVGTVKGRTAIRVFNKFRELKHRPYWGNRFWA